MSETPWHPGFAYLGIDSQRELDEAIAARAVLQDALDEAERALGQTDDDFEVWTAATAALCHENAALMAEVAALRRENTAEDEVIAAIHAARDFCRSRHMRGHPALDTLAERWAALHQENDALRKALADLVDYTARKPLGGKGLRRAPPPDKA